jgi:sec-independent protein translocase protein TatB
VLNIGPQELLVILVIALVVVGPRRLPELSRSIGKALRSLRSAQDEVRRTVQEVLDPEPVREAARDLRAARDEVRGAFGPEPGDGAGDGERDPRPTGGQEP